MKSTVSATDRRARRARRRPAGHRHSPRDGESLLSTLRTWAVPVPLSLLGKGARPLLETLEREGRVVMRPGLRCPCFSSREALPEAPVPPAGYRGKARPALDDRLPLFYAAWRRGDQSELRVHLKALLDRAPLPPRWFGHEWLVRAAEEAVVHGETMPVDDFWRWGSYCARRGLWKLAHRFFDGARRQARPGASVPRWAGIHYAWTLAHLGALDAAHAEAVRMRMARRKPKTFRFELARLSAFILRAQGQPHDALHALLHADGKPAAGEPWRSAVFSFLRLGRALIDVCDFPAAQQAGAGALKLLDAIRFPEGRFAYWHFQATLALMRSDAAQAKIALNRASSAAQRHHDDRWGPMLRSFEGHLANIEGDFTLAARRFHEASEVFQRLDQHAAAAGDALNQLHALLRGGAWNDLPDAQRAFGAAWEGTLPARLRRQWFAHQLEWAFWIGDADRFDDACRRWLHLADAECRRHLNALGLLLDPRCDTESSQDTFMTHIVRSLRYEDDACLHRAVLVRLLLRNPDEERLSEHAVGRCLAWASKKGAFSGELPALVTFRQSVRQEDGCDGDHLHRVLRLLNPGTPFWLAARYGERLGSRFCRAELGFFHHWLTALSPALRDRLLGDFRYQAAIGELRLLGASDADELPDMLRAQAQIEGQIAPRHQTSSKRTQKSI